MKEEIEFVVERADEPKPEELRRANRHDRRAMASRRKKEAQRMSKKTFTHQAAKVPEPEMGPLDRIGYMGVVAQHYRDATEANEQARGRLGAHERQDAQVLQMALQIAFAVAYMEAFLPRSQHEEVFAGAMAMKSQFKFREADGSAVKPKDEPLIVAPPPLIIPGV